MFNAANRRQSELEQRRQLHVRIARTRRRINGHTSRLVHGGILPGAWRRKIQDHPIVALATATGAGMLLAQLCSRSGAASKTADRLAEWLAGGTWATLMKQVERFLAKGESTGVSPATEPDDA
jgi:hypothetical protein